MKDKLIGYFRGVTKNTKPTTLSILLITKRLLFLVAVLTNSSVAGVLHNAVLNEDYDNLQMLCNRGEWLAETNDDGLTALHLSVMNRDYIATYILLNAGSNISLETPDGYTPIHLAALYDATNLVELLVLHQANINQHASTPNMETPLHLASSALMWSTLNDNGAKQAYNSHWELPERPYVHLNNLYYGAEASSAWFAIRPFY